MEILARRLGLPSAVNVFKVSGQTFPLLSSTWKERSAQGSQQRQTALPRLYLRTPEAWQRAFVRTLYPAACAYSSKTLTSPRCQSG
jgi:hypothetical protein